MLQLSLLTLTCILAQATPPQVVPPPPVVPPPSGPGDESQTKRSAARPPLSFDSPLPIPDVAEWINGAPPDFTDRQTLFVIVFWASNITPAREALPRISRIADAYKDRGVVVVGMTAEPAEGIRPLLESSAYKESVRFAIGCDPDRSTYKQFMNASWQTSLPTVFLAKAGRVLWIGTPHELEKVLTAVLNGTWTVQGRKESHERDAATIMRAEAFEEALNVFVDRRDWDGMLLVLGEMELDSDASLAREGRLLRVGVLQQAGRTSEALQTCDALVESTKDWMVAAEVARMLSSPLFVTTDTSRSTLAALKGIALSKQKQAMAYEALSHVQARAGQRDLALRSLERALSLALPDERDVIQERIELLKATPEPVAPAPPVVPAPPVK